MYSFRTVQGHDFIFEKLMITVYNIISWSDSIELDIGPAEIT